MLAAAGLAHRPAVLCRDKQGLQQLRRVPCLGLLFLHRRQANLKAPRLHKRAQASRAGTRRRPAAYSARREAVEQLLRIEQEGAFVGAVGGSAAPTKATSKQRLADRDRRFVTEVVSGCVRWQRRLDFVLEHLTGAPAAKLDAPLRQVLRMALYELLELGAPQHVINEHVDLCKQLLHSGAGGFCNGVLRTAVRLMAAGAVPRPPQPPGGATAQQRADLLGIVHSHPTWMVERWLEQYGEPHTVKLLRYNNTRPAGHGVRTPGQVDGALLQELADIGVVAEPSRFLPHDFVVVRSGLQGMLAAGWTARGFQVQDESAGLVVALLDPQPGERVLDCCAAPGAKALFILKRLQGKGRLLAMDVHARKLHRLQTAAEQHGWAAQLEVHAADLRERMGLAAQDPTPSQPASFDKVLVDVPCSGLGVLSKRADLRWRRTPADLAGLLDLQAQLLQAASAAVRPGGLVVYSTCSIEPQENAEQVAAFLRTPRGSSFGLEPCPAGLLPAEVVTDDGCLMTLPHRHGIDGAFAARLRHVGPGLTHAT